MLKDVQIDVLVLDALYIERTHGTHFSLPQSLDFVRAYRPRRTLLVGMTHEVRRRLCVRGLTCCSGTTTP